MDQPAGHLGQADTPSARAARPDDQADTPSARLRARSSIAAARHRAQRRAGRGQAAARHRARAGRGQPPPVYLKQGEGDGEAEGQGDVEAEGQGDGEQHAARQAEHEPPPDIAPSAEQDGAKPPPDIAPSAEQDEAKPPPDIAPSPAPGKVDQVVSQLQRLANTYGTGIVDAAIDSWRSRRTMVGDPIVEPEPEQGDPPKPQ